MTPVVEALPPIDEVLAPVEEILPPIVDVLPPVDEILAPVVPPVINQLPPIDEIVQPVDEILAPVGEIVDAVVPPVINLLPPIDEILAPVGISPNTAPLRSDLRRSAGPSTPAAGWDDPGHPGGPGPWSRGDDLPERPRAAVLAAEHDPRADPHRPAHAGCQPRLVAADSPHQVAGRACGFRAPVALLGGSRVGPRPAERFVAR